MADQEHYDFHYQPTGSGAISGQQVLEQTEDAINELGDYVYDNVGGAMDVAQEALETAQNAEHDAQTALDTANSFSDAIQSAQQDASTALSTAQTAQTTATNANNTAIQASQDASSAVTTANNASSQVSTLSGTVTALGQRVTTAEGNIGQNTSDITALTTRVGTAEGNITTLQNDVTIAQGNASSAMATAGTVKQQSYVLRYSSTTLVASSTNSNSLLDNTDNLKVGDKVLDSSGNIYVVTAIDTANSTFTIGTSLIDLAQDSDVVHKSGDETIGGIKSFSDDTYIKSLNFTNEVPSPSSSSTSIMPIITTITYGDSSPAVQARLNLRVTADGIKSLYPHENNQYSLGLPSRKWKEIHAIEYYYGSSDTEFSNKFVTTDTAQTISGNKTFSGGTELNRWLYFTNTSVTKGTIPQSTVNPYRMYFGSGVNYANSLFNIDTSVTNTGAQSLTLRSAENVVNGDDTRFIIVYDPNLTQPRYVSLKGNFIPNANNTYECGTDNSKWKSINGVEPSSLSLPDLDNGIDISSYFDISFYTGQTYTPPANGWISFSITSPNRGSILCEATGISQTAYGVTDPDDNTKYRVSILIPCQKSQTLTTYIRASGGTVNFAKFYPCQGNV